MNHPLEQTLARVRQLNADLRPEPGLPSTGDWVSVPEHFAPGASWLTAMIAEAQRRLHTRSPAIIGSTILQGYQWPLVGTAVACYLLDRRVPDISLANTRVGYTGHEAAALALLGGRFTALPDDPAAGHPDVTVVSDSAMLRALLRREIEAHLGAVIARICAAVGCKPRGLWLNVADALAGTVLWLAQQQQPCSPAQLEAEVDALVRVPGAPFASARLGLVVLTYRERTRVFLDRATCCYWYKTDQGEYCSTCPHRTPEDRRQRLLKYLAEEHVRQAEVAVKEAAT
jgi:hypothetical protein